MLTRLRVLDVSNNRLTSLPSIGSLTQLQVQTTRASIQLAGSTLQFVSLSRT